MPAEKHFHPVIFGTALERGGTVHLVHQRKDQVTYFGPGGPALPVYETWCGLRSTGSFRIDRRMRNNICIVCLEKLNAHDPEWIFWSTPT